AKAAYAAVIDWSVTSPDPSASDGTAGTSPIPIDFAYSTVLRMPTSWSSRTAARLLEVRSAVRGVIDVAEECSSSGTYAPCTVATGSSRLSTTDAGLNPASSAAA